MSFIAKSLVAISIMAAPSAYSADLANYNAQQFDYSSPPAFSWDGAYIGAHGGVASPKSILWPVAVV